MIFGLRDVVQMFLIFIKKSSNYFQNITTMSQADLDTKRIR